MLAKAPDKRYSDARELLQDCATCSRRTHIRLVLPSWAPAPLWRRMLVPALASVLGAGLLLGAYASTPVQRWLHGSTPPKRVFLAVLPLASGSGDANGRAFSDGVTEALAVRWLNLLRVIRSRLSGPRDSIGIGAGCRAGTQGLRGESGAGGKPFSVGPSDSRKLQPGGYSDTTAGARRYSDRRRGERTLSLEDRWSRASSVFWD